MVPVVDDVGSHFFGRNGSLSNLVVRRMLWMKMDCDFHGFSLLVPQPSQPVAADISTMLTGPRSALALSEQRTVLQPWQDVLGEEISFSHVGVAGKNEGLYSNISIGLNLG